MKDYTRLSLISLMLFICTVSCNKIEIIESYETGEKKVEAEIKNNLKNGKYRSYFQGGGLKLEGTYKEDKRHGLFTFYDSIGFKAVEGTYYQGLRNGIFYEYYPSGNLRGYSTFNMDTLQGEQFQYYESGKIRFNSFFEENQLLDFEEYDSSENLINWKMRYTIKDWDDEEGRKILFTLENQKFDIIKVEIQLFKGDPIAENFITDFEKSAQGNELDLTIRYPIGQEGLTISGKILDLESISDSTAIIKNYDEFDIKLNELNSSKTL